MVKKRKKKKHQIGKFSEKKNGNSQNFYFFTPSSPHFTAVSSFPIASHVNDY